MIPHYSKVLHMYARKRIKPFVAAYVPVAAYALFLLCSPMEPLAPFDRIESSRIRPVGMVVSPFPEGAPGDTLAIAAHFAGKPIVRVSDFRVCKGEFDTVGAPISLSGILLSSLPDSVFFGFQIPDTILDSVIKHLQKSPEYVPEFDQLLTALQTNEIGALRYLDSSQLTAVMSFLNEAYQKCRIMFTVSTADGESLRIRKDFMVRYNYRFQTIQALSDRLPVNHNPEIAPVGFYSVSGDTSDFDPVHPGRRYSRQFLQGSPGDSAAVNDTIEIDTGYSYFFGTKSTIVDKYLIPYPVKNDPSKVKDSLVAEKFSWTWLFEQEGGAWTEDDGMTLQQGVDEGTIKFFPPLNPSVTGCTIWVKASDYLDSKAPRPTGTARTSVKLFFKYTDAYRQAMGW